MTAAVAAAVYRCGHGRKYVPRHETFAKRIRVDVLLHPTVDKYPKDLKGNQIKLFLRLAAKVLRFNSEMPKCHRI